MNIDINSAHQEICLSQAVNYLINLFISGTSLVVQ